MQKYILYLRKNNLKKLAKDKNIQKFRNHCHYTGKYRGAAHSICNLKFNVPNKITVVFHNCSNYDYHFIIKEMSLKANLKSTKRFLLQ